MKRSFINAALDVILNVLNEHDVPDAQLIRECLVNFDQTRVEKLVTAWDKLSDMERINLQHVCLNDSIQREWLSNNNI